MKKVVFFNHFHNGDIHASRGLVRQVMNKLPELSFTYSHRNPSNLLADIPNLSFDQNMLGHLNNHSGIERVGETVYINTWYAQQNFRYMNRYGITMDSLYVAFDDTCRSLWGFSLTDICAEVQSFFPIIDYSKFEIGAARAWLYNHPEKKIFVENGIALSGQATNFVLTPIIITLAKQHPDKIFILSNKEGQYDLPINVIYSSDIIRKQVRSDLNENSFLTTHCDMIIGRASGAFTFALTQENLFHRKTKFICLSNLVPIPPNKFWVGEYLRDKVNYSAEFIVRDESHPTNVFNLIHDNL